MMDLIQLYEYAEDEYIDAEYNHGVNRDVLGRSMETEYGYWVGLNPSKMIRSEILEKVCLAHEIGHCETGTIHTNDTPVLVLKWYERRAWRSAFNRLVPEKKIKKAVRKGIYEVWDLADHFDVPDWFMYHAICYYKGICTDIEISEDMGW